MHMQYNVGLMFVQLNLMEYRKRNDSLVTL